MRKHKIRRGRIGDQFPARRPSTSGGAAEPFAQENKRQEREDPEEALVFFFGKTQLEWENGVKSSFTRASEATDGGPV